MPQFHPSSHAPAGRLAVAAVPLFIVLFPLGVLCAVLTDPNLRWHLDARRARRAAKVHGSNKPHVAPETEFDLVNPMSVISRGLRTEGRPDTEVGQSRDSSQTTGALPTGSPPPVEPTLAPFLSEYLYAAWWFKLADLAVLGCLAVMQGTMPRPATMSEVLAKATLSSVALAVLLAATVLRQPFSSSVRYECVNNQLLCRP